MPGFSGRDMKLLIGGLAAGILGSRLVPPMVAMARGAAKGKSGDPFEKLTDDHRVILGLLRSMENVESGGKAKRFGQFLLLKRKLAKHALAEEDVVYPLLVNEAHRREAAKHLYDEHADMKVLLFGIENAIMSGSPWTEPVRRLRQLVESHAREEEEQQFPKLREVLSQKKFSTVGAQVHREEALIV